MADLPKGTGPTVLIVSLTHWVAQIKAEGMLAKALELEGFRPVVLTHRASKMAHRYFQVFGIDSFIFFDDELNQLSAEDFAAEAATARAEAPTFASMLSLTYREIHVGRHVLSSIVRSLMHGSVDFDDERVQTLIETQLPQAMMNAVAAQRVIKKVAPTLALFNEKGYTPYGQVFDAAINSGVEAIQWVHSHRADSIVFKRYDKSNDDVHPFSLSAETWERVRDMEWTDEHETALNREIRGRYEDGTWFRRKFLQVGKTIKSRQEVVDELGLDPGKKTAIVFSHVLWDATFFYGENLFDDYEQWLLETIRAAAGNDRVNWIVKVHPDYVWKMKHLGADAKARDLDAISQEFGRLPEHITLMRPDTDISTFSLFDVADYCITVRGTIGIEMPCFGIPVITAGTGRYSGLGFTIEPSTREDYVALLQRIEEQPPLTADQTLLANRHALALLVLRPCPFSTFTVEQLDLDRQGHPLDHNVSIHVNNATELVAASDMRAFATWAAGSTADYVAESVA